MDTTFLDLVTGVVPRSAIGVLAVDSKVDRLFGRVDILDAMLHIVSAVVMDRREVSSGDPLPRLNEVVFDRYHTRLAGHLVRYAGIRIPVCVRQAVKSSTTVRRGSRPVVTPGKPREASR